MLFEFNKLSEAKQTVNSEYMYIVLFDGKIVVLYNFNLKILLHYSYKYRQSFRNTNLKVYLCKLSKVFRFCSMKQTIQS